MDINISKYILFDWIQSFIHFSSGVNQKNFIISDTWIQGSQNTSISCITNMFLAYCLSHSLPLSNQYTAFTKTSGTHSQFSAEFLKFSITSFLTLMKFCLLLKILFLLYPSHVVTDCPLQNPPGSYRLVFLPLGCYFWTIILPSFINSSNFKFYVYYPECNHIPIPDLSPSFCDFDTWLTVTPSKVLPLIHVDSN